MHWLQSTGYLYLLCSGVAAGASASNEPQLLLSPSLAAASFLLPLFGELCCETGDATPASNWVERLPLGPRRISFAKAATGSSSLSVEFSLSFLWAFTISLRTAAKNLLLPPPPDPSPAIFFEGTKFSAAKAQSYRKSGVPLMMNPLFGSTLKTAVKVFLLTVSLLNCLMS